jgi:hypothetical protein
MMLAKASPPGVQGAAHMDQRAGQVVHRIQRAHPRHQIETAEGPGRFLGQSLNRAMGHDIGAGHIHALSGQSLRQSSGVIPHHQRGFGFMAQERDTVEHILDHIFHHITRRIRACCIASILWRAAARRVGEKMRGGADGVVMRASLPPDAAQRKRGRKGVASPARR